VEPCPFSHPTIDIDETPTAAGAEFTVTEGMGSDEGGAGDLDFDVKVGEAMGGLMQYMESKQVL
jgi:hypothetical protein